MFLDDMLIELCKESDTDTPEKIQQLNKDIFRKCEEYYKGKLIKGNGELPTKKEVKVILDRTFNLFDSFVRQLKKSDDYKLNLLGELFEKYTFKKQLLKNEKMAEIYNSL